MPSTYDRNKVRKHLKDFELNLLFTELGWDHGGNDTKVDVANRSFFLKAIAQKCGMVVYQYVAGLDKEFPEYPTRQKIEKAVTKKVREHIIVYISHDKTTQYWQWVKRVPGHPDRARQHIYHRNQSGEALIQKLERLMFSLEKEDNITIIDVLNGVGDAFGAEKVSKNFYGHFKEEHRIFLRFIDGIKALADREWYASLMLSRMMFIYFIQKRGFLDNDTNYLHNRLKHMQKERGKDRFQTFYRHFLLRLFHEGLAKPEAERKSELDNLLGRVPYLNGGFFEKHDLERKNKDIHIPDEAFQKIFAFFDTYQWHLDDRPLHNDKEINPDVLGHIFEKYINQKQMGAYYTKEDITGYISRSAIIPFLFDQAKKECAIVFKPDGGVWHLLQDDPDRYFYESARHGITYDIHEKQNLAKRRELPSYIANGVKNISQRSRWNKDAPDCYALPNETWREHVARRQHYEQVHTKLVAGEITSINDLITYNLNVEKFAQDVILGSEGPELIHAFWKALNKITILDPTCGSGAFLFAALNVLEPLYISCLEAMQGFYDDLECTKHNHHPDIMKDFRKVLDQVSEHANENYFILKSITVNSLYGVDIMEEAIEICKLRLFLKLVAQLDGYDQIEPLPDIDFNIRAGNTLVGFASLKNVEHALKDDLFKKQELPEINERATKAGRAFHKFHEIQTDFGTRNKHKSLVSAKSDLRKQINGLKAKLDNYLAVGEYGITLEDTKTYEQWHCSHQPFHWFVEFYGIMCCGGFDVIIGNPPYLEKRKVQYSTKFLEKTDSSKAIHAMCIERSLALCKKDGGLSMIVPLALVSTQRMTVLQHMLEKNRDCWYSNYADSPGKLFDTVDQSLTIFIAIKPQNNGTTFSTGSQKWNSANRRYLIPNLRYVGCPRKRATVWVPKFGHNLETSIFKKCTLISTTVRSFIGPSQNAVYYRTAGGRYWKIFTDFPLEFYKDGVASNSSTRTCLTLTKAQHVMPTVAILSSDIFWWWYTITSDLWHLTSSYLGSFPVPESAMNDKKIRKLGAEYIKDLRTNSIMHVGKYVTGKTKTQKFEVKKSKEIINEIDKVLAPHYGLTDEELDFLMNYDIKFRMGIIKK